MFLFADGEDTYPQPKAWCAPTGNDDTGEVDNLMKPFKTGYGGGPLRHKNTLKP